MIAVAALASQTGSAFAEANDQPPSVRGPAKILGFVPPDFPNDAIQSDSSVEIKLRLTADEAGKVRDVVIESVPNALDESVVQMARQWMIAPELCRGSKWISPFVRTSVVFTADGRKRSITLRDSRWLATGNDDNIREARPDAHLPVKMRQPRATPVYPKEALAKRIHSGYVVLVAQFGADGKPIAITRMFQWPAGVFARSVANALLEWEVDPNDESLKEGKPFGVCFDVTFSTK